MATFAQTRLRLAVLWSDLIHPCARTDNNSEWVALIGGRAAHSFFYVMRRPFIILLFSVLAALSFTACRKNEIVTYRVSKNSAPAATATTTTTSPSGAAAQPLDIPANDRAAMANTAVTTASGPGLGWTAPAAWTAGPELPMRKATLLISGDSGANAELAITAFPGDVGGNLANVNRWRQQLGTPPISEAELGTALQHMHVGPLHVDVVELIGSGMSPTQRVLGAIVPYSGSTWFFKMTGPDDLVAREKPAFLAFLQTIRPQN